MRSGGLDSAPQEKQRALRFVRVVACLGSICLEGLACPNAAKSQLERVGYALLRLVARCKHRLPGLMR